MDLKQKYRPTRLEDFLISRSLKEKFIFWRTQRDFPNLLLHGPVGVGKSTLARILVESILLSSPIGFNDFLYLNASEKTSIDNVRNELQRFTEFSAMEGNKFRAIILDEADNLSIKAQAALRGLMDESESSCRYIYICNSLDHMQEAIVSRCFTLLIMPESEKAVYDLMLRINQQEGLNRELKAISQIVEETYPDIRKILTLLENVEEFTEENKEVRQILRIAQKDTFYALNRLRVFRNKPTFSLDYLCHQILKELPIIFPLQGITDPRVFKIFEALGNAYERVKNGLNFEVSFIYLLSLFRL